MNRMTKVEITLALILCNTVTRSPKHPHGSFNISKQNRLPRCISLCKLINCYQMLQNLPLTLQGYLPAFLCFGLVFWLKDFACQSSGMRSRTTKKKQQIYNVNLTQNLHKSGYQKEKEKNSRRIFFKI